MAAVVPEPVPHATDTWDEPIVLYCQTCGITGRLALQDAEEFRDAARRFFILHAECATTIDLGGQKLQRWAL